MNQTYDIPIWRKYTLTVEEALCRQYATRNHQEVYCRL